MNTEAPAIGDRITVNTLLKRGEKPLFSFKIEPVCAFFALP